MRGDGSRKALLEVFVHADEELGGGLAHLLQFVDHLQLLQLLSLVVCKKWRDETVWRGWD